MAAAAALLASAVFSQGAQAQSLPAQPGVSAPTIDHLVAGEEAFTVAWSAPPEVASAAAAAYDVRWIRSDAADKSDRRWQQVVGVAAAPGYLVVRGLDNDVRYDVQVRAVSDETGAWSDTSTVTPIETPAARSEDSPAVTIGVPLAARRNTPSDADMFKLVLTEPTLLMIRATDDTTEPKIWSDNSCLLLDEDGVALAQSDDGYFPADGLDYWPSREFNDCVIHHRAPAGTYYIETYFPGRACPTACWSAFGKYRLHVEAQSEPGSTIAEAAPIGVGELKSGEIASAGDIDYVRLDGGDEDEHIALAFRAYGGVRVKASLVDGDGNQVSGSIIRFSCNDDGCSWAGADIRALLPAGTTYYAKVEADSEAEDTLGVYGFTRLRDRAYAEWLRDCRAAERPAGWNDALSGCQWRLYGSDPRSHGYYRGADHYDANVAPAHAAGYLGTGATVSIVDAGVDVGHEDLADNADASRSHAYCGDDTAPFGDSSDHGTAVAGLLAARDNSVGMRGVAPRATLYSRRLFCYGPSAQLASADIVDAWTRDMADIGVSSNSWGSSSSPYAKPAPALEDLAIEQALARGFNGKGVVFVFSAGNGRYKGDNANLDGTLTHHGAVAVCATVIGDDLLQGDVASYSEHGSNLWVCAPAGRSAPFFGGSNDGMATTTNYDRYRFSAAGTSFAAPIVAGVAALVRAENPELTWRDVKLILAGSAQSERYRTHYNPLDRDRDLNQFHLSGSDWDEGALKYGDDTERYWFSHGYGFGAVDAHAAVQLAQDWTLLPEMITATAVATGGSLTVPDDGPSVTSTVTFDDAIGFVEWVEIDTDFEAESFRQLRLELESPSGAISTLVPQWDRDDHHYALSEPYRFASARHLGETAEGTWTLRLIDTQSGAERAVLNGWSITLYGHRLGPSTPRLTSIDQAEAGELRVAWEVPTQPGASSVTGYELRHRAEPISFVRAWLIDRCSDSPELRECSYFEVLSDPQGSRVEWLVNGCRDFSSPNCHLPLDSSLQPKWTVVEVPGGADVVSHTITELDAVPHEVQVRARNSDGAREWSSVLLGTPAPDTDPPVVTAVEVVSDAGVRDTYALGDVISVKVLFSEDVDVTGTPTLGIDMDPAHWGRKDAVYASGSGTAELVFTHEVVWPNFSTQGIAVLADTLSLAGGTIQSAGGGIDADLSHSGLAHDGDHKVDWQQSPPDASGNRAPFFVGSSDVLDNALPDFIVTLKLPKEDFVDPDGDELTFTLSASRSDVHAADGFGYIEGYGRVWFRAKTACALAALDAPPGDAYDTVITLTATDPGGASQSATVTFRTDRDFFACPSLSEAVVDGSTLTISLEADGALPPGFLDPPTAADFEVKADGTVVSLADADAVTASTTEIVLELASAVTSGQAVTVSYAPGDNPVVAVFTDHAVTNNTPAPELEQSREPEARDCTAVAAPGDATMPICTAVSGDGLTLTFNRSFAAVDDATARTLRWAFLVDGAYHHGTPISNQSPSAVTVDGSTITLTLGTPIAAGDDATVRYFAAAAGNSLKDTDGTPLADFTATHTTTQRD